MKTYDLVINGAALNRAVPVLEKMMPKSKSDIRALTVLNLDSLMRTGRNKTFNLVVKLTRREVKKLKNIRGNDLMLFEKGKKIF